MNGGDGATWPPGATFRDGEGVPATCAACGLDWRIHESMAGFRLRCRCGAWIDVPVPARVQLLPGMTGGALSRRQESALAAYDDDEDAFLAASPRPRELAGVQGWDGRPLRPDADGSWSLRHASIETRAKWTNGTVLSLAAIMACFWVPPLAVQLMAEGPHESLYMPLASVASSLLVLVVAHAWREYATEGLRDAKPRYFLEAIGVAAGSAVLAVLWSRLFLSSYPGAENPFPVLREELGLPMLLVVISLCPGVFEELAFRGLLQGRLSVLMGPLQGALVGGAAFALAHGITMGLPFHAGLGIYLSFLRTRSGSLLPGMAAHMLYNAGIVIALLD